MTVSSLPEGHYLDLSNDMRLHYLDLNPGGAGAPVIFLQGSGPGASGWGNFQFNAPVFAEEGFRVLVPDLPGYGYSSKPQDVDYTLDYFVGYINEMLEQLGVARCSVVGNSLGGAIGLGLTLAHPEQVERLILMAPGGIEDQPHYFTMPAMTIMKEVFSGGVDRATLTEFVRKGLVYDDKLVTETLMDQRWGIYELQNQHVIQTMQVPNMEHRLDEIRCPVQVFWGMDDLLMPESGIMKLAKNIDDVRVTLVSRCGHWVMVEHPELFNQTSVNFLRA